MWDDPNLTSSFRHLLLFDKTKHILKSTTIPSATNGSNGTTAKVTFDTFQNVINGKLVSTSQTRHGINPAIKKALPEVPIATQQDVDSAVKAAKEAIIGWSRTSIEDRRAALLKSQVDGFAKMLTTEQGKPVGSVSILQGND